LKIDKKDLEILQHLRENARLGIAKIAKKVGLSATATRYRFQKIKKFGLIKKTFNPIRLPQYKSGKKKAFRMQIILRATNEAVDDLVKFIQKLDFKRSQIECWKTIGHFNILVWIISENPIDFHLVKGKIQNQPGILELQGCIVSNIINRYSKINLEHLIGRKKNG
jgi:DNA-binding Lrp family transcriptional regulator